MSAATPKSATAASTARLAASHSAAKTAVGATTSTPSPKTVIKKSLAADFAHQPHDKFFKNVFADIPNAIGFFENYLPKEIVAWLDLDPKRVTRVENSFIADTFKKVEADLLFGVPVKADGQPGYIYVLWEHQYKEDKFIGFRLLCYMVSIWKEFFKTRPNASTLPFVFPLVFAQNKTAYRLLPQFGTAQFSLPAALAADFARYIPAFDFALLETAKLSYDAIQGTALGRLALRVMKAQREGPAALASDHIWKSPEFQKLTQAEQLRQILIYMLQTGLDKKCYEAKVAELPKTTKGIAMTAAQEYYQDGVREGEKRGEQRGKLIGYIQAFQEMLGLRPTPDAKLSKKPIEELESVFAQLRAQRLAH